MTEYILVHIIRHPVEVQMTYSWMSEDFFFNFISSLKSSCKSKVKLSKILSLFTYLHDVPNLRELCGTQKKQIFILMGIEAMS